MSNNRPAQQTFLFVVFVTAFCIILDRDIECVCENLFFSLSPTKPSMLTLFEKLSTCKYIIAYKMMMSESGHWGDVVHKYIEICSFL